MLTLFSARTAWGLALALVAGTVCVTPLSAQAAPANGSWVVVASPNGGTTVSGNSLLATAAVSSSDVWAVGADPNPSAYLTAPLAEHWDGSQWSIVQTPTISEKTAQLNSISALSSADVWAAGYSDNPSCLCGKTIVERWDGNMWTRITSPNPGVAAYLNGISGVSDSDVWAVGYEWGSQANAYPFVMHYNGNSWSTLGFPQFSLGQLSSVFALASNDVWAVGWSGSIGATNGLALHWNGQSWKPVSLPKDSYGGIILRSVSGAATNDVWAVGDNDYFDFNGNFTDSARSYHWNGSRWNSVNVGLGGYSYLKGVASISSKDVWAVGAGAIGNNQQYTYVTYHWDGSRWSNSPNPNQGILNGVTAVSSGDVWAVGVGFVVTGTHTLHYTVP